MAYNTDFKITSKRDIAMSRQPKFLMLASELSYLGKERREQGHLEREKSESSKSERFL